MKTRIIFLIGAIVILFLPSYATGQKTEEELLSSALTKALGNDLPGAIADCTEAIKQNPKSDKAYNQRGNLRGNSDDVVGAIADYSTAISLAPEVAVYHSNRAGSYAKRGDAKLALADYETALKLKPNSKYNDKVYLNRGRLKLELKDYEGAVADFGKALGLNPALGPAFKARAKAYRTLGKTALAEADEKNAALAEAKLREFLNKPR